MKKKKKTETPTEDEQAHPWLINYNKKDDPRFHIEQLKKVAMSLEDNLGFVSIVTIINSVFILVLVFGSLITGAVGLSGAISDSIIGTVKGLLHK